MLIDVENITGSVHADLFYGGTGRDTVAYSASTAGVSVTHDGRDGTDTIFNIEALKFADDMVFL